MVSGDAPFHTICAIVIKKMQANTEFQMRLSDIFYLSVDQVINK